MYTLLESVDLAKTYGTGDTAVEAVKPTRFLLMPSEAVAIMGPSGSGKTTLLSMWGCILKPTGGQLIVQDREITGWSERHLPRIRLSSIGFIFQSYNLLSSLTALENLLVVAQLKGLRGQPARVEAESLLDQVGLADRLQALPRDLSGGQQQRVAIARALVGTPPIVLADEPTGNLDSQTGMEIIKMLREMARERLCGVVIVTHDTRITDYVDRVLQMEDGALTDG